MRAASSEKRLFAALLLFDEEEIREFKVFREIREFRAFKVFRVIRAFKVFRVIRVFKVFKVFRVIVEQLIVMNRF